MKEAVGKEKSDASPPKKEINNMFEYYLGDIPEEACLTIGHRNHQDFFGIDSIAVSTHIFCNHWPVTSQKWSFLRMSFTEFSNVHK